MSLIQLGVTAINSSAESYSSVLFACNPVPDQLKELAFSIDHVVSDVSPEAVT